MVMSPASVSHITYLDHNLIIQLSTSLILSEIFVLLFHLFDRLFWLNFILWLLLSSILVFFVLLRLIRVFLILVLLVDIDINLINLLIFDKGAIIFLIFDTLIKINRRSCLLLSLSLKLLAKVLLLLCIQTNEKRFVPNFIVSTVACLAIY